MIKTNHVFRKKIGGETREVDQGGKLRTCLITMFKNFHFMLQVFKVREGFEQKNNSQIIMFER